MRAPRRHYIPLFWRLFLPNAAVLIAAGLALHIQPANGRLVAIAGGLVVLLAVNVVLMRRAFGPLRRLIQVTEQLDPLRPGERLAEVGPESEVALLTRAFNAMLDRFEIERRESALREVSAQEAERRFVAAELHDEIGQNLTALTFLLGRPVDHAPAELRASLAEARAIAAGTVEDVRRLARRLRPEVLDTLGLAAALANLCQRVTATTELRIDRRLDPALPALGEDVELVVYRIAQECLTNVLRHAGARRAQLRLYVDGGHAILDVVDDGVGFPPGGPVSGSGIRGMRERALLVGADLRFGAAPEGGARVTARVPLPGVRSE